VDTTLVMLVICAAVVFGAVVGLKRSGGAKKWASDVAAGLRQWRRAGVLGTIGGVAGLVSAAGAIVIWAIYTLDDVGGWAAGRLWGDPVWPAHQAYPASALIFALATICALCMASFALRDAPTREGIGSKFTVGLSSAGFGAAALVGMLVRSNEAALEPSIWLYALPVITATLASVWAVLMTLVADHRAKRDALPEPPDTVRP
jgi:hypothetical protein